MGKRFTLEDIKNYIKTYDKDNECTLLSTEYINSSTPLKFKCNLCGEEFKRDFAHLKRGRFTCSNCAIKKSAKKQAFSIEDIIAYIKENDKNNECTLLSTKYVNVITPLKFKCNLCGKDFERDAEHLFRGRFRCPDCGREKGAKALKYSADYVKQYLEKEEITLVGEYINAATGVLCKCPKGHEFNLYFSEHIFNGRGCPKCAILKNSGEGHWNYNGGGHQEVMDMLRHYIAPWKKDCLKKSNFKCEITGRSDDLVVHHFVNFSDIVKQASKNTNIPILNYVSEYSLEDREKLSQEVLHLHEIENGIVLTREIHDEFHKIYGKEKNTKEQFLEFKQRYLSKS